MTTVNKNGKASAMRQAGVSMILRLSRGRSLKVTFRPRIRVAKLLVKLFAVAGLLCHATAYAAPPAANALPTGGQVVYGNTNIQQAGNTLNINQASQKTIINWQSFDIGSQAAVNFYQPNASAIALNRILGDSASQIYGKLNANGQVFLLNPHGTLFAPNAQVNVGGLLASTMQMSNEDFISGAYSLSAPGNGILDNQGIINANSVVFAGNNINNSGSIIATSVSLVAGDTVAVDLSGDGLIRARVVNPAVQAQITNSGLIDAVHQVTMSTGQVKDTLNSVVNNTGIVRATGLIDEGGVITLQGGTALNSGTLNASSATGKGGTIAMLGEHVGVTSAGKLDASGKTGGGTILVGGDFQGKNPDIQNASRTYISKETTLNANATDTGNGGKVIVWADDVTRGYGSISARGGAQSGNGGFVEVSGKHNLDYQGVTDTRAPNGSIGTLLLDPDFIDITVGGTASLTDADAFADPLSNVTIAPNTINSSLANVMLQANEDINFNSPIAMTSLGTSLTARAGGFINVNASISTMGGGVTMVVGDPGSLTSPTEGSFNLGSGSTIDTTGGGSVAAGADVSITSNLSDVGGNSIFISGNINAGTAGTIELTDTNSRVEQAASSILTANNLLVQSSGPIDLVGPNQINRVVLENTGSGNIVFNNTRNLTVGSVASVGGNVSLQTTTAAKNITIDGPITADAGNVSLTATGNILSTASGLIDTQGGNGNITLSGASIGDVAQSIKVAPGSGNVSVTTSGNAFVKHVFSALDTAKYTINATANNATVRLNSDNNINITTLANFATSNDNLVFFTDGGDITLANNLTATARTFDFGTQGVGNDILVGTGAGSVSLDATNPTGVNFTAHTVTFNNDLSDPTPTAFDTVQITARAGGVNGSGAIFTNNLRIESEGAVNLTGNNQVSKLAADVSNVGASFTFNNSGTPLEIFNIFGIDGITTNNGAATITVNNGSLTLSAPINLGTGNLALTTTGSVGAMSVLSSIQANDVTLSSGYSMNIDTSVTATGDFIATSGTGFAGGDITLGNTLSPTPNLLDVDGNITLTAQNASINFAGDIKHKGATTGNLTANAGESIFFYGGSIDTISSSLNVSLTADANADGLGNIKSINPEFDIQTGGGNATLVAGSLANPITFQDAVYLNQVTIEAEGGNISITGVNDYGDSSAAAVVLQDSNLTTTGSGTINVSGTAKVANVGNRGVVITHSNLTTQNGLLEINGDASLATASTSTSDGILINGGSHIVTEGTGNINITGKSAIGGASQAGIALADTGTEIDAHGSGNITLDGVGNGAGGSNYGVIMFNSALIETEGTGNVFVTGENNFSTDPGLALGSGATIRALNGGDIDIRAGNQDTSPGGANHIELNGGLVQGTAGSLLFLRPLASKPSTGIAVGGDGSALGGFNLSDGDLATISGFNAVQIGDTAHTGTFNVATLNTFSNTNQQLNLVSNGALIDFTAPTTTLASSLLVNAVNGSIELNSLAVTGKLTALAHNNITLKTSASVTATDKILLAAQTGNFINNAGVNALSATNHWTVVSQDPSLDTRGGLVYNYKQYNTTYDPLSSSFSQTIQGTGDGFVYAIAPSLTTTLTGNPDDISKVYDATTTASVGQLTTANFNASGLVDTDVINSFTASTLDYIDKNVGTGKTVTATSVNLAITDSTGANVYGYTNQNISTISGDIGEITAATLSLDAVSDSRTYNADINSSGVVAISGLQGSDTVTGLTQSFDSKNVGSRTLSVDAGYTVNDGNGGNNYIVTTNTNSGTIIAADITAVTGISANNKANYDGTTNTTLNTGTASFTGIFSGDSLNVATATGNFTDANAGTGKTVNITGITLGGADASNYNLLSTTASTTADIGQADLTVTANDLLGKIYGDTAALSGTAFTSTPLVGSETIGSVTLVSPGSSATASVGAYAITPSAATGGTFNPANYNITYVNGSMTVTPKPITVTADNRNKVYGNTLAASGTEFTSTALANGETIGSVNFFSTGGVSTANVGSYTLTPSNATGGTFNPANYTITYANGNLAVTPLSLVITAGNQNKVYGDLFSFTGTEFTSTPLANGETIGSVSLSSPATLATANAGSHNIIASSPTGGTFDAANYSISYVNGTFVVTQAPLTLSAVTDSRIYDGTKNSSASVLVSGLKNADTVSGLQQEFDTKNVGSRTLSVKSGYTINDGNGGNNYIVTTNTDTGSISPKDMTVSATGINKIFDGTLAADVILSSADKVGADDLSITKSSASFITPDAGLNKQIDVNGIAISGTDASNYNLLNTTAVAFADIINEDGTDETSLTEKNAIDSTQNLQLAVVPVQLKIFNENGTESLVSIDVPKGKVLSCK